MRELSGTQPGGALMKVTPLPYREVKLLHLATTAWGPHCMQGRGNDCQIHNCIIQMQWSPWQQEGATEGGGASLDGWTGCGCIVNDTTGPISLQNDLNHVRTCSLIWQPECRINVCSSFTFIEHYLFYFTFCHKKMLFFFCRLYAVINSASAFNTNLIGCSFCECVKCVCMWVCVLPPTHQRMAEWLMRLGCWLWLLSMQTQLKHSALGPIKPHKACLFSQLHTSP